MIDSRLVAMDAFTFALNQICERRRPAREDHPGLICRIPDVTVIGTGTPCHELFFEVPSSMSRQTPPAAMPLRYPATQGYRSSARSSPGHGGIGRARGTAGVRQHEQPCPRVWDEPAGGNALGWFALTRP